MSERIPPQALDAEESIVGAMMLSPRAIPAVVETGLVASDFYRDSHGVIYSAAVELDTQGGKVDAITLVDFLDSTGRLKAAGGADRVHELAALVPAASNAAHYAQVVIDNAKLRGLIRAGADIQRLGWDRPGDIPELVNQAESILFDVTSKAARGKPEPLGDLLRQAYQRLQRLHEAGETVTGVASGWPELDKLTTGFQPGSLIILAARPSMGKTALATNIVENTALAGVPSLVFSLEMSKAEVAQRLISSKAKVESDRLRTGRLDRDDWGRVTDACKALAPTPVHIDDAAQTTVSEIRSKARRYKMQNPNLGLIVIDYLQLITLPGNGIDNRAAAMGEVSRALKVMARDLDVPIVALAQLSRKVEERGDKRPMLSDLRDSGAIEQDADVVMFLYRDDYYHPDSDQQGLAELHVAKQRNGPTGLVKLAFLRRYAKFQSVAA